MKLLIGLLVIVAVVWLVRAARRNTALTQKQSPPAHRPDDINAQAAPTAMLQCHRCGLHLPAQDVVHGRLGAYCTEAHRLLAED